MANSRLLRCHPPQSNNSIYCGVFFVTGKFVLDTFAGTGSLLVALAHWGAQCMGFDIDMYALWVCLSWLVEESAGEARVHVFCVLMHHARLTCLVRRILQGKKTNLFGNFDQYSLPYPEMLRLDVSPRGRSAIRFQGSCAINWFASMLFSGVAATVCSRLATLHTWEFTVSL